MGKRDGPRLYNLRDPAVLDGQMYVRFTGSTGPMFGRCIDVQRDHKCVAGFESRVHAGDHARHAPKQNEAVMGAPPGFYWRCRSFSPKFQMSSDSILLIR